MYFCRLATHLPACHVLFSRLQTMATHQADIMALIRDILVQQLNDPQGGWVACLRLPPRLLRIAFTRCRSCRCCRPPLVLPRLRQSFLFKLKTTTKG